jgi:hypothetical protein
MEGPPDREVGNQQQVNEPPQRHGKRESPPELERGDSEHGPEVPAKTLRRGVLQTVGHIGDRQACRFEEIGGMEEANGREIVLRGGQSGPGKP